MNLSYFKGCMIGLTAAAPPAGLSILCVRRTLTEGWLCGMVSGLGIATADACYSFIAGLGIDLIEQLLNHYHYWLRGFAGLLLCGIGCKIALTLPTCPLASAKGKKLLARYGSMLALTLADPVPIFLATVVLVGIKPTDQPLHAGMLSLGVFSGSALWWLMLCSTCELLRFRLQRYPHSSAVRSLFHPATLKWLNRIAGAVLFSFGLILLSSL